MPNSPLDPLPRDLGQVPPFLARIAAYIDASLIAYAGPGWPQTAAYGALVVAVAVAGSALYVVRLRGSGVPRR